MIIDGQKWACEACLRGHRVSTCKHHDRPLIRINKKGRPFAVCSICRSSPCKEPEEHSRLRRETEMQSSKKATSRHRPASTTFVPIAPRPKNASSPTVQTQNAGNPIAGGASSQDQPESINADESARQDLTTSGTTEPFQIDPPSAPMLSDMSTSASSPFASGYPTDSQMSGDFPFPDNAFDCLEYADPERDDWSSFLWTEDADMLSDQQMWEWRYPDPTQDSYNHSNDGQ
ncbi:hypothetical protein DTO063F5_2295 [Paecilomyces variotii]|nr:hypothetical protein DTO063F5_2295 [Paecilomyces variotii]